jgi:hypothetical protein
MPYFPSQANRPNPRPQQNTELLIDNGDASTTFENYLLRFDFGTNGAEINPDGIP